jgi:magnesium transporter
MQFEVTEEYLDKVSSAIKANDIKTLEKSLKKLHAADIASVLDNLDIDTGKKLYNFLDDKIAADALIEMDEDKREVFLASLTSEQIADQLDHLPSDEATDVIQELPDNVQDEVLRELEKDDAEQAHDIVDLLKYDENTAGGLMQKELVKVNIHKNMLECVRELRKHADRIEDIYAVYVVDDADKLMGMIDFKKILTTSLRIKIAEVYESELVHVKTNTDVEEVAHIMEKYNLVFIPVVDELGKLAGRITIDDVVDVIRKEETEDVQKMAAVQALDEPYMNSSIYEVIKKRVGWLLILFVGESFTATAMSFFENEISKAVVLALFVPLIISSGGNIGSQASTLIIRSLALGEISIKEWWKIFSREVRVGLLLGVLLGFIGFLRVIVWSTFVDFYGDHAAMVGLTVGLSLLGVVLWGNLVGSIFPLLLKRLGLDPAVSSAPFVATLVDITGLVIYFTIASLLLKGILL